MALPFEAIDRVFSTIGPKVIAEIGAADGLDTIAYAHRYPQAFIHAFEPLQRNVDSLRNVVTAFMSPRIYVHPVALGNENKTSVDFWESKGAPLHRPLSGPWPYSSSLLPPKDHLNVHAWCTFEKTTANVVRFEDYYSGAIDDFPAPAPPDYVHIDVQGAELEVLRGFGERLKDVRAVWMEVSSVELYAGQPLYSDVEKFMLKAGFEKMIDTALGKISGDQFWRRP